MKIAIGNVGSTSLKTKIFDANEDGEFHQLGQADLDRVLSEGESSFKHSIGRGENLTEKALVCGFEQALKFILDYYLQSGIIASYNDIEAVGFKTVLAGNRGACVLSDEVIDEMKKFAFVAPTHNLPYINTISQFRNVLGDVPLIGVFEPSFHYSIPLFRRVSGLPFDLEESLGLGQRGYHGSSGRYGAARAYQLHNEFTNSSGKIFPSPFKLIFNHLGGSSSTHAIVDGVSVATSMKFSNQSGHFQGTRIGDIDGFALLYVMKETSFTVDQMNDLLSQESGLKGISGIESGEMADIQSAAMNGNSRAQLARDAYEDRVKQYIGAYTAALNGVDAIVFSGGIGENGIDFRSRVCAGLEFLGIELDETKNKTIQGTDGRISSDISKVQVYVIHTDEELVVAYFTREVIRAGRDLLPEEMKFTLPKTVV